MGARPPIPREPREPTTCATRDERGAALLVTIMTSAVAALLGMGILMLSEAEQLRAKAWSERARSRAASRAAVELAASWFASPQSAVGLPEPSDWDLDQRRGDSDLDGAQDEQCDGSKPEGRWQGFPLVPPQDDPRLDTVVARACGERATPDLLLQGDALERISRAIGKGVVIERLAVSAGPEVGGSRSTMTIEAVASVVRGRTLVGRVTAIGRVAALPRLTGSEAIAAGGNVRFAPGASACWGDVRSSGDIDLPPMDDPAFPRSGLPRRGDGSPVSYAPGGVTNWGTSSAERLWVLTELLGRTRQARLILTQDIVTPELADPWLRIQAGGVVRAGGKRTAPPGARQPWPYDPRVTTVQDDLSFVLAGLGTADPLCEGRARDLADALAGATGGGPSLRRFLLDASSSGEPRWRENGAGVARTASDWLDPAHPVIASFTCGGATPPETVTLRAFRGVVLVEAGTVVLDGAQEPAALAVNMPGEPYIDHGVDADGDLLIDAATVGNRRWDIDADGDGVADATEGDGFELEPILPERWRVPDYDRDPARLPVLPHEAYLNFEYPQDMAPGPVRLSYRAEAEGRAAPVADRDGDGVIRAGFDRVTTLAPDERGALVTVPAHAHAVVANLTGGVVLGEGYQLVGAVRARGGVTLEKGARVRLDAQLARTGRLSLDLPGAALTSFAFTRQGVAGPRAPGAAPDEGADAQRDSTEPPVQVPSSPSGPPRSGAGPRGPGDGDGDADGAPAEGPRVRKR